MTAKKAVIQVESLSDDKSPLKSMLVTFPGVVPPQLEVHQFLNAKKRAADSALESKKSGKSKIESKHADKYARILFAETDRVEYLATNTPDENEESTSVKPLPCRFAVGVYNPDTEKVIVNEAPVYHFKQTVKALKNATSESNLAERISTDDRRSLGETFGTRKALNAIRSYDRGQIDVGTLADVAGHIESSIDKKASKMQTSNEIEKEVDQLRLIPPFNAETAVLEEVYPLEGIIPKQELDLIPTAALLKYKKKDFTDLKKKNDLPEYILQRLENAIMQKNEVRTKQLVYLWYLIKLAGLKESQLNRRELWLKDFEIAPMPPLTEKRLLNEFTEAHDGKKAGSKRYKMPMNLKEKLIAYICALILHIDAFTVAPAQLAKDLQITSAKATDYFKQLGCSVESSSVEGVVLRRVRLQAPVQFPKAPRGRRS